MRRTGGRLSLLSEDAQDSKKLKVEESEIFKLLEKTHQKFIFKTKNWENFIAKFQHLKEQIENGIPAERYVDLFDLWKTIFTENNDSTALQNSTLIDNKIEELVSLKDSKLDDKEILPVTVKNKDCISNDNICITSRQKSQNNLNNFINTPIEAFHLNIQQRRDFEINKLTEIYLDSNEKLTKAENNKHEELDIVAPNEKLNINYVENIVKIVASRLYRIDDEIEQIEKYLMEEIRKDLLMMMRPAPNLLREIFDLKCQIKEHL